MSLMKTHTACGSGWCSPFKSHLCRYSLGSSEQLGQGDTPPPPSLVIEKDNIEDQTFKSQEGR